MPPKARTKTETDISPDIEVREYQQRIEAVTKELNQSLIGAFKVTSASCNTTWEGPIQNREPNYASVNRLVECLRLIGLQRMVSEHHMLGSLDSDAAHGMLEALHMSKEDIRSMNEDGKFPNVPAEWLDEEGIQIQLEAGQHRFLALEVLFPDDESERWCVLVMNPRRVWARSGARTEKYKGDFRC
jgi:hypothetical protein